jgi:hypothetical protein
MKATKVSSRKAMRTETTWEVRIEEKLHVKAR